MLPQVICLSNHLIYNVASHMVVISNVLVICQSIVSIPFLDDDDAIKTSYVGSEGLLNDNLMTV